MDDYGQFCPGRTVVRFTFHDLPDESEHMRGPERLRRTFPDWLGLSMFAGVERPVVA